MGNPDVATLASQLLNDKHHTIRMVGLETASSEQNSIIKKLITSDPHSAVRNRALQILSERDPSAAAIVAESVFKNEKASFLANTGDKKYLTYIEENLDKVGIYQLFNVFGKYSELLLAQDIETVMSRADMLKSIGIEGSNMYKRYLATNTLNSIQGKLAGLIEDPEQSTSKMANTERQAQVKQMLSEIISKEEDETLQARYQGF